jgi:hypothetical protein
MERSARYFRNRGQHRSAVDRPNHNLLDQRQHGQKYQEDE